MGPSDRKEDADQAFKEIAELLRTKYGVEDLSKEATFGFFDKQFNKQRIKFHEALREVFKWDSYNGF